MRLSSAITDLADQAVLIPLAIAVTVALDILGWRRGAVVWASTIAATLAVTGLLKLAFMACGRGIIMTAGIHSPSGHTAAAAVTYGGALALLVRMLTGTERWTIPCAALVAAVFGQTRLMLDAHTDTEVIIGALVGIAGAVAMIRLAGELPPGLHLGRAVAIGLAVVPFLYGIHMPAEAFIATVASRLGVALRCS